MSKLMKLSVILIFALLVLIFSLNVWLGLSLYLMGGVAFTSWILSDSKNVSLLAKVLLVIVWFPLFAVVFLTDIGDYLC